ncbi:PLP-dependent aminotransferase family protein [Paraferrimonas sp. SM1919]|uniref:MocR-like pyridoxine biosynthesis transcription factor PdxR n=1 Tax=Paraferrimonas sp. SM1919 TaxID=2662263 RepID=UPI0013D05182|nr:PLP-dependent aminotransferase family protein [Paraferrimonas sp. SM1919]
MFQLFHIEINSQQSLQSQLRMQMIDAINSGAIPLNIKLPSSRQLAKQLKLSRNTVVLVYQSLLSDSYLISKERSGMYVNPEIGAALGDRPKPAKALKTNFKNKFVGQAQVTSDTSSPDNWHQFKYPFIDGRFDESLFPTKQWQQACNLANGQKGRKHWFSETSDDDPQLVEQIKTQILPRRGIFADADEILITMGSQQSLQLICELLIHPGSRVGFEEPGFVEMRRLFERKGANIHYQNLDEEGILVDSELAENELVYVTPSHQTPTAITMSMQRRQQLLAQAEQFDQLIIEDDFEFESNFLGAPHPSLRSLDQHNRVIYCSCLSKVLSSGLQLGFIVAAKEIIDELRRLRQMLSRHPSRFSQRAISHFIELGHYQSFMLKTHKIFYERWLTLREALNIYLPAAIHTAPIEGGTAFWVMGPEQLDGEYLRAEAAKLGILIEPVKRYFAKNEYPSNCFRLGVAAINQQDIQAGVALLAKLIGDLSDSKSISQAKGVLLNNASLKNYLEGAVVECQMVYGIPCQIEFKSDGTLIGHTYGKGNENESDVGRWWIKDNKLYRRWQLWSYGETGRFYVVADNHSLSWFDENHRFVRDLIKLPGPNQPLSTGIKINSKLVLVD